MEKTALITGATSGIGLAAARALAMQGVCIIGIGRSTERCEAAKKSILRSAPGAYIEFLLCDLSSQAQIRKLCNTLLKKYPVIDIIIHAAGVIMSRHEKTQDGLEMQFAVNHMVSFLLTRALLSALKASVDARVILISSLAHRYARLNFADLQMNKGYNGVAQYRHTKLCNVLFAAEFNRRFKDTHIRAFAADPGIVKTNIGVSGMSGLMKMICRMVINRGADVGVAAKSLSYLALSPQVLSLHSIYWKDCRPLKPDPYALSEKIGNLLWEASERLISTAFIS